MQPVPSDLRPPAFAWNEWYAAVGGRSISIEEVDRYLRQIFEDQYPRFEGEVAPEPHLFASPHEAARDAKAKALEFGADIAGICAIEPSDVYRSICLPVCAYNHKEWARDFEGFTTKLLPTVVMSEPPARVDPLDGDRCHVYERLPR